MSQVQNIIDEFEHEMNTTKRFFKALTDDVLSYSPHEKSMTLAQLANHMQRLPRLAVNIVEKDTLDWATEVFPENPTSSEGMYKMFNDNVALAKEALAKLDDEVLAESWSMKNGETVYFTLPKRMAIRNLVLNHTIHHRGQFGVYLRMNNISVPASYGQSADETA